jgi:hypothetical protein
VIPINEDRAELVPLPRVDAGRRTTKTTAGQLCLSRPTNTSAISTMPLWAILVFAMFLIATTASPRHLKDRCLGFLVRTREKLSARGRLRLQRLEAVEPHAAHDTASSSGVRSGAVISENATGSAARHSRLMARNACPPSQAYSHPDTTIRNAVVAPIPTVP